MLTEVSGNTKTSSHHKIKLLVNEAFPKIDTRQREIEISLDLLANRLPA
jgi:hypothetical protein